jgi:hypothetical protein
VIAVRERSPHAVNEPAAIGVEQSSSEAVGMLIGDNPLPRLELDPPVVLLTCAVLREQTGPVR